MLAKANANLAIFKVTQGIAITNEIKYYSKY